MWTAERAECTEDGERLGFFFRYGGSIKGAIMYHSSGALIALYSPGIGSIRDSIQQKKVDNLIEAWHYVKHKHQEYRAAIHSQGAK